MLLSFVGFVFVPLFSNEEPDLHPVAILIGAVGLALAATGLYRSMIPPRQALVAANARTQRLEKFAKDHVEKGDPAIEAAKQFAIGSPSSATQLLTAIDALKKHRDGGWEAAQA